MPETRNYTIYDTATFSDSAKQIHDLFQVRQGTDATNDQYKTNSKGNGQFPESESMLVEKIIFYPDSDVPLADLKNAVFNSNVVIEYRNQTIFEATLRECIAHSAFGGHYSEASASDDNAIGLFGNGYELEIPIMIEGGNSFRVKIAQGTALSSDTFTFKLGLVGKYTQ